MVIPAAMAVLIHGLVFFGLMRLPAVMQHKERLDPIAIVQIERLKSAEPSLAQPGLALRDDLLKQPPPLIAIPVLPRPSVGMDLDVLNPFISCGMERQLNAAQRRACDERLGGLTPAEKGQRRPDDTVAALDRGFARDKAREDAPVLLPCFTPAGPNLLCLLGGAVNGFHFETGSYADVSPPESPLSRPAYPYRPK